MFPGNVLSSISMSSKIIGARGNNAISNIVDYEDGGVALNDANLGLMYQTWRCRLVGNDVILDAPNIPSPIVLYSNPGITEISFTFDQNMRPTLAFVQSGQAKMLWYDFRKDGQVITNLPIGTKCPKVILDDKRAKELSVDDIIVAYILNSNLYIRLQRDRYGIEYLMKSNVKGRIWKLGMGSNMRLQFCMKNN